MKAGGLAKRPEAGGPAHQHDLDPRSDQPTAMLDHLLVEGVRLAST